MAEYTGHPWVPPEDDDVAWALELATMLLEAPAAEEARLDPAMEDAWVPDDATDTEEDAPEPEEVGAEEVDPEELIPEEELDDDDDDDDVVQPIAAHRPAINVPTTPRLMCMLSFPL